MIHRFIELVHGLQLFIYYCYFKYRVRYFKFNVAFYGGNNLTELIFKIGK